MASVCMEFPEIPHADFITPHRPFKENELARFQCHDGYVSRASPYAKCLDTGDWEYTPCIPQNCGHPFDLDHGHFEGLVFTFPHSVTYSCDEGYTLRHRSMFYPNWPVYCMPSGRWSTSSQTLQCIPTPCPPLSDPKNGHLMYSHPDRLIGSDVRTTCEEGFKLVGPEIRQCQPDQTWEGETPRCEKVTCPSLGDYPNGRTIPDKPIFEAGDIALWQCPLTQTVITAKCLPTGQWSQPRPPCGSIPPPVSPSATGVPPSIPPPSIRKVNPPSVSPSATGAPPSIPLPSIRKVNPPSVSPPNTRKRHFWIMTIFLMILMIIYMIMIHIH